MSDLNARLRLEVEGAAQAANDVGKVEDALRDVGQAGSAAASGMAQAGKAADQAADEFAQLRAATQGTDLVRYQAGMRGAADVTGAAGKAAKLTGNEMLNLGRQASDVGVTLAMGMNPLMILVQQGPQIAEVLGVAASRGISTSAAFRQMAAAGWAMVAPLAPFIAGAAAVAAIVGGGLLIATHELNKEHKDLAKTYGLTDEQLKKVKDTGITVGDVLKGGFTAAAGALKEEFAPQIKAVVGFAKDAYDFLLDGAKAVVKGLVGGFGYAGGAIGAIFKNIPGVVGDALVSAANLGIAAIEFMVNAVIADLNRLITGANLVAQAVGLPLRAPTLDKASFARLRNEYAGEMASVHAAGIEGSNNAIKGAVGVLEAWEKGTLAAHKARVLEEAGTAKATRATRDHTKAVKDDLEAVKLLTVDLKTLVDTTKVEGLKPFNPTGLVRTEDTIGQAFAAMRQEADDLANYFRDQFVYNGRLAFGDIADYAEQELRRALYESLLAKPIKILVDAVVSGIPGDIGGLTGSAAGLTAIGSVAANALGGKTGRAIGGGLGIASAGLGAASGLVTAASMGALGSGLAASMAIQFAPLLGPIGIAAGALYAAAKLFNIGGKPSNHGAGFDLITGQISGNKRNDETEKAVRSGGDAISSGQDLLRSLGLELPTTIKGLVVGTRDLTQIYTSTGQTLTSAVGDVGAAVDTAMRAVLQGATYQSEAQKKLVDDMLAAGKDFEAITEGLAAYAAGQKIPKAIDDAILQLTDPKAWALEELKRNQQEQRDALRAASVAGYITAEQFTAASQKLTVLEQLQTAEVLKKFTDGVADAADQLEKQREAQRLLGSVGDRILELTDPAAFRVKRVNDDINARIEEAQPLIAAGLLGEEFLNLAEQLRGLELARLRGEVEDVSNAFRDARPKLLSWLDSVNASPAAMLSPKAQLQEALQQYERQLAKAQAGDASALSSITGYADQVFAADRAATGSASARQARFRQITGQISGLAGMGAEASPAAAIASLQAPLGTIAQAAAADLAAMTSGGKAVVVSNLPAMSQMYGQALSAQTDRLVAANDRNAAEIVASVKALAESQAAALSQLAASVEGAVGAALEVAAGQAAEVAAGLQAIADEARLADARQRMVG